MELDDTDVFESDDRGDMTTMIDELDAESKEQLRSKMRFLKRHAQDEDDINTKRVLNIIFEIGEIHPPYLRRHLKLISEIICRVLKSGQPQMVLRGYQTIRSLSQILKSPFSATYWKYLKLSFNNLLSPVQAIVDYALQMIYEMHSSFDPTYFIKTLRSALLHTQNANLKTNFAICLYQLLCHQKSNITQYCPTYFELFLVMNDKCKPMKQVCKETGKYLKILYGEDELKNMMLTYYKIGRIRIIQQALCLKLVPEDDEVETPLDNQTSLNESSIHMEDESIEDNGNTKRRISTTSDASEAEAKMASITIGQHKFLIKRQSPTLIPASKPYFPKEDRRRSTTTIEVQERSRSAPAVEGNNGNKQTGKQEQQKQQPHQRTISKTIERSRSIKQPYKSIVGASDTSAYEKKVERIRKSIMRSATSKNKSPVVYKVVKKTPAKKQAITPSEEKEITESVKTTTKTDSSKKSLQPTTPKRKSTSEKSNKRSPSRTSNSATKATIQKIIAKARKEREQKAAGRKQPPKKKVIKKKEIKEEEDLKQNENEKVVEEKEEQTPSVVVPKVEEERAVEEDKQEKVEEQTNEEEETNQNEEKVIKLEEEEEFEDENLPEEIQMPLDPVPQLDEPSPLDDSPKEEVKPVEEEEEVKPTEEEVKPVEEEEVKPVEEEVKPVEEEEVKPTEEEVKPTEEEEVKPVEEEVKPTEEEEVKPVEEEEVKPTEEEEVKPTEEEEVKPVEIEKEDKEADDILNEAIASEEEEEEEGDDDEKSAKEMLEELLNNISPEDKIKYQNELMLLGRITDYFDSDSEYDSYSEDSYDEDEEVKEKLPTVNEKDENIEEEDDEDDEVKDIKNWNIFDSDYEEVSDDESYTGEDPIMPGDEEDN